MTHVNFLSFRKPFTAPPELGQNGSDPFISGKKNCSNYRVHGIQIDQLGLTISTRWNRESDPVDLNTMNHIIRTIFFSLIKGLERFCQLISE